MKTIFNAKGYINFIYTPAGLTFKINRREDMLNEMLSFSDTESYKKACNEELDKSLNVEVMDTLMDGKEFFNNVDNHCIIDYDGYIENIFVDGYISNIGLAHEGIFEGKFLLNGEAFNQLCKEHDVKVDWRNR